jgi:hypothetical protein
MLSGASHEGVTSRPAGRAAADDGRWAVTGSSSRRSVPWARAWVAALVAIPLLAACGGAASDGEVTVTPGTGGSVTSTPTPSGRLIDPSRGAKPAPTSLVPDAPSAGAASGETDLTVVVDDGSGKQTTWRLTCDPPGGTHPDAAAACEALAARGATALPPVPPDRMCTQVFGGPETAQVTGTWRGQAVSARFAKTNGCEISRWNALNGLLPGRGDDGA